MALETVRLLTKHRAYSEAAGKSIARGLAIEMIRSAHDNVQIQRVWDGLDSAEQQVPEVVFVAAERLLLSDCSRVRGSSPARRPVYTGRR